MVTARRPRVAVLTAGDARNPRTWSGIPFYMAGALAAHVGDTAFIGPLNTHLLTALKVIGCSLRGVSGLRILPAHSYITARRYARLAEAKITRSAADVIVAPVGSAVVPFLRTNLPIIYTSDTTARLMFDYYPQFTNVTAQARRQADELERATIAQADLLLYPTNWVARSAIEDYGADPAKVHVQPYGANIAETPSREMALAPRRRSGCKLIFVGVDWSRKGGAIAVEALRFLRRQGVEAELTIIGCVPREPIEEPAVTVIPFLDKNDPAQRGQLSTLYLDSDFLILPTRCECYGIVFCEAAAHGLPSIATATGGVPELVRDGINGYTLPMSADGADYAALIRAVLDEPGRHDRLRESSRMEFEHRLNWDVWGLETARLVAGLLHLRAVRMAPPRAPTEPTSDSLNSRSGSPVASADETRTDRGRRTSVDSGRASAGHRFAPW